MLTLTFKNTTIGAPESQCRMHIGLDDLPKSIPTICERHYRVFIRHLYCTFRASKLYPDIGTVTTALNGTAQDFEQARLICEQVLAGCGSEDFVSQIKFHRCLLHSFRQMAEAKAMQRLFTEAWWLLKQAKHYLGKIRQKVKIQKNDLFYWLSDFDRLNLHKTELTLVRRSGSHGGGTAELRSRCSKIKEEAENLRLSFITDFSELPYDNRIRTAIRLCQCSIDREMKDIGDADEQDG